MAENLEILDELLVWALGILIAITDWLTAIGFLVTFVVMLIGGAWLLIREIVVRFRSPRSSERECEREQ